jgi:two-component system cell cycle sensor histidine kinase/response regulator CckA
MPKDTRETILVVDSDDGVRVSVIEVLRRADFRVLSARGGVEAINLAAENPGHIDLLLSEVDVPQMSGPDLGQALKMARPGIRVMLMSGQENGNLLVLNYGWAYIHKALIATKLVQMIENVLRSPDRSQIGGQEFDCHKSPEHN